MIQLKSKDEIQRLRKSNMIVAEVLHRLSEVVAPGCTTAELDAVAEDIARQRGGIPAFKGYRGFPASICASVNEEVVHGIPSSKRSLVEGDIISIDFGLLYDGFYGDAAITVPVGKIDANAQKLIDTTEQSLYLGIAQARAGNRLSDISHAIQVHVEKNNFSVVREFVGHGIGRDLHEDPQLPNYGKPNQGVKLVPGMVLAIEPMVNAGRSDVRVKSDRWTAVTRDGKLSSHFEHSVAITENETIILSRLDELP